LKQNITVGEMAAQEPNSIKVYKELGIDFCCGGGKSLINILKEKNITMEAFSAKLNAAKSKSTLRIDFLSMPPEQLAEYIEDKHHTYLWNAMPEINALFIKVLGVHGQHHTELFPLFKLFGTLKTDLEMHLIKEETRLFPEITKLNKNYDAMKLAIEIKEEHEAAGDLLEEMRKISKNYKLPDDACVSFKKLYTNIQAMEDDIHQHIHLENNILLANIKEGAKK